MTDMNVRQIIDDRGGYRRVAEALSQPGREVPLTTVHTWYRIGKVPWWRLEPLLALPKQKKPAANGNAKPKRRRKVAA